MVLDRTPAFYRQMIRNCKKNIEYIKHSNFSEEEKMILAESYKWQQEKYERKLASFS
jgi:hypothetical protein